MTHHLEAWAQTPTAHPCSTTTYTTLIVSLLCLIVFPLPPSQAAIIFKLLLTMCGLLHFILLILLVSPTLCIMKLFNIHILSVQFLRLSILYFVNNVKICILHCHYDCLLLFSWKCRNKTKLKPHTISSCIKVIAMLKISKHYQTRKDMKWHCLKACDPVVNKCT